MAKVSGEEINRANSGNLLTGLAGKVSGLNISIQSADMNPQMRVLLRGIRSFGATSNNQPLFIMNGTPLSFGSDQTSASLVMDFINNINPADIEDVTVLKGANGTALYGPEGVNGVIIITTKKGQKGKRRRRGGPRRGPGRWRPARRSGPASGSRCDDGGRTSPRSRSRGRAPAGAGPSRCSRCPRRRASEPDGSDTFAVPPQTDTLASPSGFASVHTPVFSELPLKSSAWIVPWAPPAPAAVSASGSRGQKPRGRSPSTAPAVRGVASVRA